MQHIRLVSLDPKGGPQGRLIAIEQNTEQMPFELKRIYYIYGVDSRQRRGFHAHKQLKQLLVCVAGSCIIDIDTGQGARSFVLDDPGTGLFIGEPAWREMHDFSKDCVLLVCASEPYDEDDYIRDHAEFLRFLEKAG